MYSLFTHDCCVGGGGAPEVNRAEAKSNTVNEAKPLKERKKKLLHTAVASSKCPQAATFNRTRIYIICSAFKCEQFLFMSAGSARTSNSCAPALCCV